MSEAIQGSLIKRYANRRLYDAACARYVSIEELSGRVERDEDFVVVDAGTGEDITRSVLKAIIVARGKHG